MQFKIDNQDYHDREFASGDVLFKLWIATFLNTTMNKTIVFHTT
jgi:hypothetical protein